MIEHRRDALFAGRLKTQLVDQLTHAVKGGSEQLMRGLNAIKLEVLLSISFLLLFLTTSGCMGKFSSLHPSTSAAPALSVSGPSQIRMGGSATFIAQVTGLEDATIIWSVNGIVGGNASVGTISINGLYTAPQVTGSVTISGTSSALSSLNKSLTMSVLNPIPVIDSAVVTSSNDAGIALDIVGSGFISQSEVSVDGTSESTTFLSSSELRVPISQPPPGAQKIRISVSNPSPGAAESNLAEVALPPSSLHQLVGCTNPNNPDVSVTNGDWGTALKNSEYFPLTWWYTRLIGTPSYTSNNVFWTSREARPGDSVLMTGAFTQNKKTARIALIPPGTVDWESVVRRTGMVVSTTQQGTTGLSLIVPQQFPAGVYGIEIDDPGAPSIFSLANDPSIQWAMGIPSETDPSNALQSQVHDCGVEPGELLRIFGKNFLPSSEVELESSDGTITSISPSRIDTNSIVAQIPHSLTPGGYYLWVGSTPWSATSSTAVPISIVLPPNQTVTHAKCTKLIGDHETDNTALLQSCLDENAPKAVASELVDIAIPAGVFALRSGVVIRSGEILIGSSPSETQFIGTSPDPQPNAWFTIPQHAGIAELSIKAPNALALLNSSDLSGNPTISGHVYVENVNFDSTPCGSNIYTWDMVGLSGPDIQIYRSTFLSGTNVGLSIYQGDGAIVSGNHLINDRAENYYQSSQNLIIEANLVDSTIGPSRNGNYNGSSGFDLARDFCYGCASRVTRNEYIGYNTVENIGTIGTNQVIEMDGGAGAYYGSVATATKDTVVLANDPSWFNTGISDLSGVSVAIVLGRGAGQQSFIKGANGRTITLIDPWKVIPDATSIVVITASEQNLIVAHNTFTNTVEQTILIARSVDSVVEDNVLKNSGSGIYLCGIAPYGGPAAFNPIINTDVLRNQIEVGDGDLIVPSRSVTV